MPSRRTLRATSFWAFALATAFLAWPPARDRAGDATVRGVRLLPTAPPLSERFDAARSAALFVGVRTFTKDPALVEVPYAVDDAVDLAHLVALELEAPLVPPHRVRLALSGEPQKEESKRRLEALLGAGASRTPATRADLHLLLARQAAEAGGEGLFLLAIATHEFTSTGRHFLMAEDSVLRFTEQTALATVLADAIASLKGQVVLFAARPGGYAYNDPERRNGLFTAEVLAGLRCGAPTDDKGFVTVASLAEFVNEEVVGWVRTHRPEGAGDNDGIEANLGGSAASLPLVRCLTCPLAAQPDVVELTENRVAVRDALDRALWSRQVGGTIKKAEVVDLTGDGSREVLVGVAGPGRDTGKLLVFDCKGDAVWSFDTSAPVIYQGAHSDRLTVVAFAAADLYSNGRRQIVTLSHNAHGWYPCRLCILDSDGRLIASYWHPGHLHHLAIGSPSPADPPRLLLAGVSNDLGPYFPDSRYIPVILQLDPARVGGQAPPYWGDSEPGPHEWYTVVQPTSMQVTELQILDRDGDSINEISVWTDHNLELNLDFAGNVVGVLRGFDAVKLLGDRQVGLVHLRDRGASPP